MTPVDLAEYLAVQLPVQGLKCLCFTGTTVLYVDIVTSTLFILRFYGAFACFLYKMGGPRVYGV